MQVPSDLASQLSTVAVVSGRSPDTLLREAISQLIKSTVPTIAPLENTPHHRAGFVPQALSFSVYE
jgi:predicted transcriptional regulator